MDLMKTAERERSLEAVLAVALFFLLLFLLVGSRYLLGVTVILLVGSILSIKFTSIVSQTWMKGAHALGTLNSHILLALIFLAVLTPLAFIRRIFGHNLLQIRKESAALTYFIGRKRQIARDDFEKIW